VKIVIYSRPFAPLVGGVETIVMSLAEGLAAGAGGGQGPAEVTVVTATPRGTHDDDALPFRVVRQPRLPALLALLRAADVVHIAGPTMLPLAAALLLRKRVVLEHHGFQTICPNGQLVCGDGAPCPGHFMARNYAACVRCNAGQGLAASLKLLLLTFPRRWLATRVAANITPTAWLDSLLRLPRTTTVLHGLRVPPPPPEPAPPPGPPVLTFQGRLVGAKGVAVLLEAASLLRQRRPELAFEVRVIGDGPERPHLEEMVARLHLGAAVRFLGKLPDEPMQAALSASAAVVMPSLGGEVFGLVALENMMRGRLLIVSDLGALVEVVGDAGLSFPVGDAAALSACLERVLTSPDLAVKMRRRARQRGADVFAQQQMIDGHRAVYRRVLPC
jgi:glycogen(starch) synthase